ncbi:MAG TPA: excinuclease ABC subunit UvrA [Thermodesulfobacteriota bacterium]|nr:excinuclease ABC subunit UvrA [Thermodesulfobacteriota bacterium]
MAKKPLKAMEAAAVFEVPEAIGKDELIVEGLRQNNLKNLSLRIPHNRLTAVVGPSGSGKSSLAFDTLFAEGRWRFIESLSTYTRLFLERMDRPDLDTIRNIRPAIAVEQKNPVRTSRSTVGTATELNDYLRVMFARIGKVHCPGCDRVIESHEPALVAEELISAHEDEPVVIGFTLPLGEKGFKETADSLVERGFVRIRLKEGVYDLTTERGEGPPAPPAPPAQGEALEVIVDRPVVREGERGRLVESLDAAYREGGGIAWVEFRDGRVERFSRALVCTRCDIAVKRPTPLMLSFNHPVGACPECKGFGNVLRYDVDRIVPDKTLSLRQGAVEPWTKPAYTWWYEELEACAGDYDIDLDRPFEKLKAQERKLLFDGTSDFEGIDEFFEQLERKKYKLHIKVFTSRYKGQFLCKSCDGTRLNKDALFIKVSGLSIAEVNAMTIAGARGFFRNLELTPYEEEVCEEVLRQIRTKLDFLVDTGLGYITLDRLTKTLSGGEAQRVQLATQLASSLTGVLYILDEPSVGLHPVDIDMLIRQLKKLCSRGNTVVVVEHDPSIIRASEHIVELGPGAGEKGGRLVYEGTTKGLIEGARTLTSDYLTGREVIHVPRWRRKGSGKFLELRGASGNNLKEIDVSIPLKTFTCVTGVSGSGKSTLVADTLFNILAARFKTRFERPLPYRAIEGAEGITGVKLIDQSPIGRTPRSNPVTYMGAFDDIRRIFAGLMSARAAGLTQSHFSFNIPGGRCEACKGEGVEKLEMYFLPDVYIKCAACNGRRYRPQVLGIKYRGRSIYDCLDMTFDEAAALFPGEEHLQKRFSIIREVGLGYLKLGQSATTLSGGEAQRLKISKELIEDSSADMLYIFDEPTTGLHLDDIKKLLSVLGRLVDAGNTVLAIEHNLDFIKTADYIIDLGPEGGERGGTIVAFGPPEKIAATKKSRTGRYLKELLSE